MSNQCGLTPEQELLIERAAERGAAKALNDLGLSDDDAPYDLRELRGLLSTWRDVRKTAMQTVTRVVTAAILSALAVGAWFKMGGK